MSDVLQRPQIRKFGWYGLLKNLKFFEPYLFLYMMSNRLTFTHIGLLYAIREAMVYIFEIPSGVLADRYGKKTELMIALGFYILSFVGFFFATSFVWFVLPMILFGLGEAFRSGTHKAMIMEYLDVENIDIPKRQVYGYTRSYSNVGAAVSSLFGVALVLYVPDLRLLFLVAIVPFVADLILIFTYPSYLNKRIDTTFGIKAFLKENLRSISYALKQKKLRGYLLDSASFQAVFKSSRDYIQPLIYTAGITFVLISAQSLEQNIRVYIGLTYMLAQLISVFVTKNAYKLRNIASTNLILVSTVMMVAIVSVLLGFFEQQIVIIVLMMMALYVALNIRKPYMVQRIGDATINEKRASVLSIESQLTSILIIILAPVMGWISDTYSIGTMFLTLGIIMITMSTLRLFARSK